MQIGHTVSAANFLNAAVAGSGNLINDLTAALNPGELTNFKASGAAKVAITGGTDAGTYAVINDGTAGFRHLAGSSKSFCLEQRIRQSTRPSSPKQARHRDPWWRASGKFPLGWRHATWIPDLLMSGQLPKRTC